MNTVGITTTVTVAGLTGTKRVTARVDTGARYDALDYTLAAKIGAGPVLDVKKIRSATASRLKAERRPVVPLTLKLGDRLVHTRATLADRRGMRYPLIIGRETLRRAGVLVDPTRRSTGRDERDRDPGRRAASMLRLHTELRRAVPKERAITPAILALQHGGAWSYRDEDVVSVAVPVREERDGVVIERLYLLLDPRIERSEGRIVRLEKCGEEDVRRVAERPRLLEVRHEGGATVRIDPHRRTLRVTRLEPGRITFRGTAAANVHHELAHLTEEEPGPTILDFKIE